MTEWNYDMDAVPKGEDDEVLLLFDSATVVVIRNAWWSDGSHGFEVGWYSPRHSVTTEHLSYLPDPIAWCEVPNYEVEEYGGVVVPIGVN